MRGRRLTYGNHQTASQPATASAGKLNFEAIDRSVDEQWIEKTLPAFGALQGDLKREYWRRRERSRSEANAWLREASVMLNRAPGWIRDIHNQAQLDSMARTIAEKCERFTCDAELDDFLARHSLPKVPGQPGGPRLRRAEDWRHFWRPLLRRHAGQFRDQFMRHLGYVHKRKQIYCADATVRLQKQLQAANLETLERLIAISDAGDELSLAELYSASLANPAIRRAELLTRIRGFEEYAEWAGDEAVFITITAPSKYHARLQKSGAPNSKYNGDTPRETNYYLNTVWSRIRAKLKREVLPVYGIRIVEPHHDGTPHWHLLLFHRPDQRDTLRKIFRHYALAEDAIEPGAERQRVRFETIDPNAGSATGYVIKYVAKSVDGAGVGEDLHGNDAETAASRIVAWARTWRIRQFQFIGGPCVGIWREYRRLKPEQRDQVPLPHIDAWEAASETKSWASFCKSMGGATPGRNQPSSLQRAPATDPSTGEISRYKNRYGELLPASARPVLGIVREGIVLVTRWKKWRIEAKPPALGVRHVAPGDLSYTPSNHPAKIRDFFAEPPIDHLIRTACGRWILPGAEGVGPWTRVNNCTASPSWLRDSVYVYDVSPSRANQDK